MTVPTRPVGAPSALSTPDTAGVGASPLRPDGTLKVTGQFAYASDLWMDGMLWGVTLRSPHPYARIVSVDIGEALATPGVHAVLTHEDVPGSKYYGLEIADQPVLADGRGALPRRAGRPGRRRSPGDRPPRGQEDPGRLRRLRADHRCTPGAGHPRWNMVQTRPARLAV